MAELLVCLVLRFGARFARHASSAPTRVLFKRGMPSYHELVERSFSCPVVYGQSSNAVEFKAHLLDSPQAHGDALMHAALREAAAKRALMASPVRPLAEQMREVLHSEVGLCRAAPSSLARRFGMVPSAMRRRLGDEGTSFRALINEARCRLAQAELRRGRSAQEVADVLGFAELPSFHRAFRRWTGATPRAYQRRALRDAGVSDGGTKPAKSSVNSSDT